MEESNDFFLEINLLIRLIDEDIIKAYEPFLLFVKENTDDENLRFKALLLGSEITDLRQEYLTSRNRSERIIALSNEAKSILLSINEGGKNLLSKELLRYNKLRNYFLSTKSNQVVFKGEAIGKITRKFSIKPISFELKLGEITSVIGENGNGKSTLLKMIAGEISVSSGLLQYFELNDKVIRWEKIKKLIAYIPEQLPNLENVFSIKEFLHFTAAIKGIKGISNQESVDYIIARLGLKKYENYTWSALSSGYKLRFEIARQLVWSPKLLIMDEPLAHLDVKAKSILLNDLRQLTDSLKSPISIILSSQNLYDIEDISDNIIYLKAGSPIYNGKVNDISKDIMRNSFLLRAECTTAFLWETLSEYSNSIIQIKEIFNEKIIVSSLEISANMILNKLIKTKIIIKYFRDISNSTRIFFENDKEK